MLRLTSALPVVTYNFDSKLALQTISHEMWVTGKHALSCLVIVWNTNLEPRMFEPVAVHFPPGLMLEM